MTSKNYPNAEIKFESTVQAALYNACKGQISDGMWENSSPQNHWEVMCAAKATVAKVGEKLGPNFAPRRTYGFTSLLQHVDDQLLAQARVFDAMPELLKITDSDFYQLPVVGEKIYKWTASEGKVEIYTFTAEDIAKIEASAYDLKALRKDLSAITAIVNRRKNGPMTEVTPKAAKVAKPKAEKVEKVEVATDKKANKIRINKALELAGIEARVDGKNGIIEVVTKDGSRSTVSFSKWSDLLIESWVELVKGM